MHGWINECMDAWMEGCMVRLMDEQMGRWLDGETVDARGESRAVEEAP